LTTANIVGISANVSAQLLYRQKSVLSDGAILELVVWRVPVPVAGSQHSYKYRLYYGRSGIRIVGYDNERPKGDHRHIDGLEAPYGFSTVEALIHDFMCDVQARRSI
jgi:hypothetical protein